MESNLKRFKEIIGDNTFSDFKLKNILIDNKNNLEAALNSYFNKMIFEENPQKKKIKDIVNIDYNLKGEKNVFNLLQRGALLDKKKKSYVKKKKNLFLHQNLEKDSMEKKMDCLTKKNNNSNCGNILNLNITHFKEINPFSKMDVLETEKKKKEKIKIQKKTSKKSNENYKMLIKKKTKQKSRKRSIKELKKSHKKFQKLKNLNYLGTFHKKILITENLEKRLEIKEGTSELELKIEKIKEIKGLSRKLKAKKKKGTKRKGFIYLIYKEDEFEIELFRFIELERNLFSLLNDNILKFFIKMNTEFVETLENEYLLDISVLLNFEVFSPPIIASLNHSKYEINLLEKYKDYKSEFLYLFEILNLVQTKSSPLENIKDEETKEIMIKKNFYNFLNEKKEEEDFTDFSPKGMNIKLHEFQKKGLFWLIKRENFKLENINDKNNFLNPMWNEFEIRLCLFEHLSMEELENIKYILKQQNQKNFTKNDNIFYFYFNILTGQLSLNFPYYDIDNNLIGGILADEMGLGKTIMILSLIAFTKENPLHKENLKNFFHDKKKRMLKNGYNFKKKNNLPFANTLIIMPSVLIHQWEEEIIEKFDNKISYFIYKEINKEAVIDLQHYNIVLTSYETVRQDLFVEKYNHNLFNYTWNRIILDEANRIHNVNTKNAKSIYKLTGISKWCVTGTPIENSINDLFSLLHFLDYKPWSNKTFWDKIIYNPLYKEKNYKSLTTLNFIIKPAILRRTKKFHVKELKLQKISYFDINIDLNEIERNAYDKKRNSSIEYLNTLSEKDMKKNVLHMFEIILRLRQISNHHELPFLSRKEIKVETFAKKIQKFLIHRYEDREKNKDKLIIEDNFFNKLDYIIEKLDELEQGVDKLTCCICKDQFEEPIITFCLHKFCKICLLQWFTNKNECPLCKEILSRKDILALPKINNVKTEKKIYISSKMEKLFKIISSAGKNEKIIIFSHFVTMLAIISKELEKRNIPNLLLEGSLNEKKRRDLLHKFKNDKKYNIFLISIKVGGVGLNLNTANVVVIFEPWWNPAVENQAIDRINRIGQKKEMRVYKFVCNNTVEERICRIREEKRKLFEMTIENCNSSGLESFEKPNDLGVKQLKFILS